jgi:UDP-2,3-diacylglucosamine hydrolase
MEPETDLTPATSMVGAERVLVASDFHLGIAHHPHVRAIHSWLDYAADRTRHLILNGDVFDFWFEYGHVIPRGHTRILGHLAALVDAGTRIDFFGGNHDWWGGSYLAGEVGLVLHPDPTVMDLAGLRVLVAHGDGLGQGDLGYRALRWTLRSPLTRAAFRWLHPDVGARIAGRVSRTSPAPRQAAGSPVHPRVEHLTRWAEQSLMEDPDLDGVILGHTHVPQRVELAPNRYYLNAGDWLHHTTWVELNPDEAPALLAWNGGNPAPFQVPG